jgi:hypothetical protein
VNVTAGPSRRRHDGADGGVALGDPGGYRLLKGLTIRQSAAASAGLIVSRVVSPSL